MSEPQTTNPVDPSNAASTQPITAAQEHIDALVAEATDEERRLLRASLNRYESTDNRESSSGVSNSTPGDRHLHSDGFVDPIATRKRR
jgi:hypothetical protein